MSISSKSPNLLFHAYCICRAKTEVQKGSVLKCSVKENAEYINKNFAFVRDPVLPVIPKPAQNICSLRARFQKFGQMPTDITGIYKFVKNTVSIFCTFQCLITQKNLVNCFLTIFNLDTLPVFVLILPVLQEQKEKKIWLMQQHFFQ